MVPQALLGVRPIPLEEEFDLVAVWRHDFALEERLRAEVDRTTARTKRCISNIVKGRP